MTNQEAIEIIKTAIAEVEWEYPMDYATAFDEAIKSLEKQIPTEAKPFTNSTGRGWACGNCGFTVSFVEFDKDGNRFYETPSYCKWCGQKIDGVISLKDQKMNYCIEKGIACNDADYQGWCNSTKCCDKTISGGKGNSITYTIKNDNIIENSLISSKPSWCDRSEPCAECGEE